MKIDDRVAPTTSKPVWTWTTISIWWVHFTPSKNYNQFLRSPGQSTVMVFWIISNIDKITVKFKETWKYFTNIEKHQRENNKSMATIVHTLWLAAERARFSFIIWLCLTRTGNYQIHEFDWLKWILTAV